MNEWFSSFFDILHHEDANLVCAFSHWAGEPQIAAKNRQGCVFEVAPSTTPFVERAEIGSGRDSAQESKINF